LRDLFLDERRQVVNKLLRETMARYEGDYRQIFDGNRRLIDFLREIDSPVPRPLQVAADVAMTQEALEIARRLQAATIDPLAAQSELLTLAKLAARLGARIDLEQVRRPLHAEVRSQFDNALAGSVEAAQQTADLLGLARQLNLHLDLWPLQNKLWEAVRTGTHDRAALAPLAGPLWFDEVALLARLDTSTHRAIA